MPFFELVKEHSLRLCCRHPFSTHEQSLLSSFDSHFPQWKAEFVVVTQVPCLAE